jgi:hypothetical protein
VSNTSSILQFGLWTGRFAEFFMSRVTGFPKFKNSRFLYYPKRCENSKHLNLEVAKQVLSKPKQWVRETHALNRLGVQGHVQAWNFFRTIVKIVKSEHFIHKSMRSRKLGVQSRIFSCWVGDFSIRDDPSKEVFYRQ